MRRAFPCDSVAVMECRRAAGLYRAVRVQGGLWREFLLRAGDVQADILLTVVFVVAVGASRAAALAGGVRFFRWRRGEPRWLPRDAVEHDLAWAERQG